MSLKLKKKDVNKENEDINEDEEEIGDDNEEDMEDQFEAALASRGTNTWKTGGVKKDIAIRGLIQCFGSMIESFPSEDALPDHRGRYRFEEMIHKKLLDASKQVLKAKRYKLLFLICLFCM
jgi:hypothetical protein